MDPLAVLQSTHERIEALLVLLEVLESRLRKEGCDAQSRSAAQLVLDYFDTAEALHHRDEDEDLFPLLRVRAASEGRAEIAAAIDELEREHDSMAAQWQRLRARLVAIAAGDGSLDAGELERFVWLYRRHMEREGAALLPFARLSLGPAERAALAERMALRRQ